MAQNQVNEDATKKRERERERQILLMHLLRNIQPLPAQLSLDTLDLTEERSILVTAVTISNRNNPRDTLENV